MGISVFFNVLIGGNSQRFWRPERHWFSLGVYDKGPYLTSQLFLKESAPRANGKMRRRRGKVWLLLLI